MYTDSTLTTSANPQQTDIFWQPKKIGLIFSGLGQELIEGPSKHTFLSCLYILIYKNGDKSGCNKH